MKHLDIYGVGAALVDTEIKVSDQQLLDWGIQKGVMTLVDEARQTELLTAMGEHLAGAERASGGSAANTIIGAAWMGAKTGYACRVADDDNGRFYLADMDRAGVQLTQDKTTSASGITGKCLVMITPDAERTMNTYLGTSEGLAADNLHLDHIAASQWLYLEGYLVTSDTGRPAAIAARNHAEQHATRTALSLSDPAMVQFFRDGLLEMIGGGVDLLFCNRDEALGFTQTQTLNDAAAALKHHCRQFAITLGAEGALLFDGEQEMMVAGQPACAVDTNGAGDMFAGAFLYGLTQGWDFARAGELANRAAAQVVSQYGPRLTEAQYRSLTSV
ncbi:adenosine kinase [Simiduia agarivorans]|uniref:Kinase, pfkB family protein n=1 Tax=Simiduia agarivorans (strain DSM 21679 / JCM 13881 / BCRC 17597 / SA1) TaxID=1117647 RepID=K4KLX3_SIMAS|nr:adenosine kinase [Simiduia agarivorans]AFU99083.1 kinase, pfkB family protein [Simiduia agarivorans SA1 = DSM 21679]